MKNTLYPLKALLERHTDLREAFKTVVTARAYVNDLIQEIELKIKRDAHQTTLIDAQKLLGER